MLRHLTSLLLLCAALGCGPQSGAQDSDGPEARKRLNGIPLYQIFDENDIEDNARGNFITSSPDNRLYFGNETGIYVYDGSNWKLAIRTVATRDKIRSIHWTDDEIYAAGYNTFGTLELSAENRLRFRPINQEPLSSNASEFYGDILENGDWLYFIGQRNLALYNRVTKEIRTQTFDTWLTCAAVSQGHLYIATDTDGLWKEENGTFQALEAFSGFTEEKAIEMMIAKGAQFVIATQDGKLHAVENDQPKETYSNLPYKGSSTINSLSFLDEQRLAVSIPSEGIVILNSDGSVATKLSKDFDYRWGAVRQLHTDRQGTLWVMFNASIGKVLIDSPITPIDERLRPNVYYPLAQRMGDQLYLTTHGRLYQASHDASGQLVSFEDIFSRYDLSVAIALPGPDGLYVHAEGTTYLYTKENGPTPLGSHHRIDRLVTFRDDPNLFLGTSSTKAILLKREGMSIREIDSLNHTAGLVNKIARAPNNVFWLEIGLEQAGKIWIENGELRFRIYTAKDGLPADWVAIWEHEGDVFLTESSGVFEYDEESDRFNKIEDFEIYFPSDRGSLHRLCTDPSGNIWASYNNYNYILWKQADGSYRKDSYSLSQLGDLYINEFAFLENGNAVLLTESEIFQVDASLFQSLGDQPNIRTRLFEIADLEGEEIHFSNTGIGSLPERIELSSDQSSFSVRIGNTFSATLRQPSFQYYIEGASSGWSKWSAANEFSFTNLDHGDYVLRMRTRLGELVDEAGISLPISITPSIWQTPFAYLCYLAFVSFIILSGYRYFSRNLKSANEKLEIMVAERTREIEAKNAELQHKTKELTKTLDELRDAQDQLISTSRKAGMAEVATNVLHNVGNVLNSINVGVLSLSQRIDTGRVEKLERIVQLIERHSEQLDTFFTTDPKGRAIPDYLRRLALVMKDDFAQYQVEIDCMSDNISHVKRIISTQQAHAKTVEMFQEVNLPDIIDSAITMIMGDMEHTIYEVTRQFDDDLTIVSDKHLILQMVANFIKNAKESISEASPALGIISIEGRFNRDRTAIELRIHDNGVGISSENLKRIFTHGFTTKRDGHGFGMHSCSNSAKRLGGDLSIASDGPMKGATVTLTLPVKPTARELTPKTVQASAYPKAKVV
ncbi:ATP-binding protein [Pelagicoccus sp. SDUM812003]|uniref:ATP-binding protein n=1 Tax=Pelagicoccus sp. SDUM812003 TaxID=3041267 RepID=UPI00280FC315|nr:ATP-binding protein [Pelagicoccus sp. SDUM812003]MDQ8204949.1 ATP-binding protein [Pelagicoccus sp. SDUM812003]